MKSAATNRDIAAALDYIYRHACEGLSVERLVKETQRVSQVVFLRRFRAATGQAPRAAILRRQLDEARRLLADTELSLVFIAEHCGFRTLAALERTFRAAEGRTPAEFRKRWQTGGKGQRGSSATPPQTRKVPSTEGCLSQTASRIPRQTMILDLPRRARVCVPGKNKNSNQTATQ